MSRGFTLIELLVVLVILALAMGIAAPAVLEAGERGRLDAAASKVYDGLRRARSTAVTRGELVTLYARRLVNDSAIGIESAVQGVANAPLTFYPDGSAASARVTLSSGDARRSLSVDWLTGHASLVE